MTADYNTAVSSKALRNRIEGFGSGGASAGPPSSENFGRFWNQRGNGGNDGASVGNWLEQAKAGMDAMVEALDETANAFADAVEDTISAIAGEDKEEVQRHNEQLERERRRKLAKAEEMRSRQEQGSAASSGAPPPPPRPPAQGEAPPAQTQAPPAQAQPQPVKARAKVPYDDGTRSGVVWQQVIAQICESGNLEEFALNVRGQCKNEAEEAEVGALISSELLNAVRNEATLRLLHVIHAILEADLPYARAALKERCQVKIKKLQEMSLFRQVASQILQMMGAQEPAAATTNGNASSASTEVSRCSCGTDFMADAKFCRKCGAKRVEQPAKKEAPQDLLDVTGFAAQAVPSSSTQQDLIGLDLDTPSTSSGAVPQVDPLLVTLQAPSAAGSDAAFNPNQLDMGNALPSSLAPASQMPSINDPFTAMSNAHGGASAPMVASSPNSSIGTYSALGAGLPLTGTVGGAMPSVPMRAPMPPAGMSMSPAPMAPSMPSHGPPAATTPYSATNSILGSPLASAPALVTSPTKAVKNEIKLGDAFELAAQLGH